MGREVHDFRDAMRTKPKGYRPGAKVVPFREPARRPEGAKGFGALLAALFGCALVAGYVYMPDRWFGGDMPAPAAPATAPADMLRATFGLCHSGGGTNCVVDGDTFWFRGEKIRIADIDTPETHPPRCAEEARLGAAATAELHRQLNAGPFSLERIERDTDHYGRKLRVVTRGGESLGGALVGQGLARWYEGGRRPWC